MRPESGLLQIGRKLEKWQWHYNFLTWRNQHFFWRCFVSLVKFSYWSTFHVNIINGTGLMTVSFYKGNPKIGNTAVWILPNIWWLERFMNTEFCPISGDWGDLWIPNLTRRSLIKCYSMPGLQLLPFLSY